MKLKFIPKYLKLLLLPLFLLCGFDEGFSQCPDNSITVTTTPATCFGASDGTITITVDNPNGYTGNYTFRVINFWTITPVDFTTNNVSHTFTGLPRAPYVARVVNMSGGCTDIAPLVFHSISQPNKISATHTINNNSNCTTPDGSISLTVSGGVGPFGFSWTSDNGFTSNSEDITGLSGGKYTVTITDQSTTGCSETFGPYTVTDPSPAKNLPVSDPTICNPNNSAVNIVISNTENGVEYELQTLAGTSFTPQIKGTGNGTNLTLTIPQAQAPTTTTSYRVRAVDGLCTPAILDDRAVVTVNNLPVATFNYPASPYCSNGTDPTPTFTGGGVAGIFSSSVGLVIDPATGTVDLSASTAGTYTVTNTIGASGGCPIVTATSQIVITALPIANFSYANTPYCKTGTDPSPALAAGGVAGTFTSSTGLAINATTGVVDLSASTAGTYTVTNTVAAANGCPEVTATATITINNSPVATFNYPASPYCSNGTDPSPTFTGGGVAGTFSSSVGLVIDPATGTVDLSASTAGTYTVTNTIAASGSCPIVTATSSITITALPIATFSYANTPYCKTGTDPSPTLAAGGVAGTFTSSTGLAINATTGVVDLSASTAGTYTVTNTVAAANGCPEVTATATITINNSPVATFNYPATPYCSNGTDPSPTFTGGGVAGTFSSSVGLVIDPGTGTVNLSASTAGTYTVTNTIGASGGCPIVTATSQIVITALPIANFSYANTPYCKTGTDPSPTLAAGGVAGTFTSSTGLAINATTGVVDLSASTAGTYTVTNTVAAANGCPEVTATATITINNSPVATFNYPASPYCSNGTDPSPTFTGGGVAGTFSSSVGLVIDPGTGTVNLSASTAGTYTVTNTIGASGGCPIVTATSQIVITALPIANFSYANTPYCKTGTDPSPTLAAGGVAGTFTSSTGLAINATTGVVDLSASTAGTYTVTNTVAAANGCPEVTATATITINNSPVATFNYPASPYCSNGTDPSPTFTGGGVAGTFSSSVGLVIDPATGTVDLSASTTGTYTVTNTIAASGGCPEVTATSQITITALPIATFSYANTPYCKTGTDPNPTFTGGGVGGTFTSSTGLVINATTGVVDLSASTAGTYTVTNTVAAANGCPEVKATTTITINNQPVATFNYPASPYCSNGTDPSPTFTGGGVAGTFSSSVGLVIDPATGTVDLSASTAGTYTVTNTIAASGGCPEVTATSQITITALPIATFSYANTPYCKTGTDPNPTFTGGGVGGTFTSSTGLVINATTGVVDLSASTAGTYTVTNTVAAANGCPEVKATTTITINNQPVATFNYPASPYCSNGTDPSPTFTGGGVAGTFSSSVGLVIDPATGTVDLSASTAGTYTVTNTIAASGGCPEVTATSQITITALPIATFSYANDSYCKTGTDPSPTLATGAAAGTFTARPVGLSINATTGAVDLSTSTAGTYTVTNTVAASAGCPRVTATTTITINTPAVATFNYPDNPYCSNGTNPTPTFTGGGVAGTFSSSVGLVIDPGTGTVDLSASTAGTYTVTNTIAASGGCPKVTATSQIIITALPIATFSYADDSYCKTGTDPSPTLAPGGVAGTFTSTTGLVINATTGVVDLSASTAGIYTVTNTVVAANGCPEVKATTNIRINNQPVATFNYPDNPYCSNGTDPSPTFTGGGVAGTFSSSVGLVINPATGTVDLSASTAGTYNVTNTIAASGGCPKVTATSPITITALPIATFSYANTPYCKTGTDPSPTFTGGGVAGTFTSTTGLVINATTGVVDLSASTAGIYTVTNTVVAANGCPEVKATTNIRINNQPVATFNYPDNPYCSNGTDPTPTFTGGGVAGTFTATPVGLSINPNTGAVDLSASTAGTYTVTNTIGASGGCPIVIATSQIVITALPIATFSYANDPYCKTGTSPSPTLPPGGVAGTFTSTTGLVINATTGVVDLSASTAGTYTVTNTVVAANGCSEVKEDAQITIIPIATATLSGNTTICSGISANLNVVLTGKGPWDIVFTDNTYITTVNNITTSPFTINLGSLTNSTDYRLMSVSDACGGGAVNGLVTINVIETTITLGTITNPTTCNGSDGSIALAFTNVADGRYTITYDGGRFVDVVVAGNQSTITGLRAGAYNNIKITARGCTSADGVNATLLAPDTPSITLGTITNPTTCNGSDGSIALAFTNVADGRYTITYDGGRFVDVVVAGNQSTITGLRAGAYNNIKITARGCTSADGVNATLLAPDTPSITLGTITNPTTCNGSDGSIALAFTNVADGRYTITYDGGRFVDVVVAGNQSTITGLRAGAYNNIKITARGCTSADGVNATLLAPDTPSITLGTITNPTTCNGSDGSIALAFTNVADGRYTITYDGGRFVDVVVAGNQSTITGLRAGAYNNIKITARGCTSADGVNATLLAPDTPSITLGTITNPTTCNGSDGSIALAFTNVADGRYTITYDGGRFVDVVVAGNQSTITGLRAGAYNNIKITARGCTSADGVNATLLAPDTPSITLGTITNPTTCNGSDGSIALAFTNVADGRYTITYDGGRFVDVVVAGNQSTITGLRAGAYNNIKITARGCTSADGVNATLLAPDTPSITLGTITNPTTCNGSDGSIALAFTNVADGRYTITYDGGRFVDVVVAGNQSTITGLRAGAYNNIKITARGCTSADGVNATLLAPDTPSITLGTITNPTTCNGSDGSIALAFTNVADGRYTITYDGGRFVDVVVAGNQSTITGLRAGAYNNIKITARGCTSADGVNATLLAPDTPSITLGTITNPTTCNGSDGSIALAFTNVADGRYTITYDGGRFVDVVVAGNQSTITGLRAGAYNNIKITARGCTSADGINATLLAPDTPSITLGTITNPTTCNGSDGSIALAFTNVADGRYTITYDGGRFVDVVVAGNQSTITGLRVGAYNNIKITARGCTSADGVNATLKNPNGCANTGCGAFTSIIEKQGATKLPTCADPESGSITYQIAGGSGLYEVQLRDITDVNYTRFGQNRGGEVTVNALKAATYFVIVKDVNTGAICDGSKTTPPRRVTIGTATTVKADTVKDSRNHVVCHGNKTGSVNIKDLSGSTTGNYFYSINGGAWVQLQIDRVPNFGDPNGLIPGTNAIRIGEKADDPCPQLLTVVLNPSNPAIVANGVSITEASCGASDGKVKIATTNISGGSGTFTQFEFNGKNYTALPIEDNALAAGTYPLKITDDAGCSTSIDIKVSGGTEINPSVFPMDATCDSPSGASGSIFVSFTSSTPDLLKIIGGVKYTVTLKEKGKEIAKYEFDLKKGTHLPASHTFKNLGAGTYAIEITTDDDACGKSETHTISGTTAISFNHQVLCTNSSVKSLRLYNIKGENGKPYRLKYIDRKTNAVFVMPKPINLARGTDEITITGEPFLKTTKEYILRLEQQQTGCVAPQIISSDSKDGLLILSKSITAAIKGVTKSLPDRPTGTITIHKIIGGFKPKKTPQPYSIRATLRVPAKPGQEYSTDFQKVELNPNTLGFEKIFTNAPAGSYLIEIIDLLGCGVSFDVEVPLDTDIFIPNVFTPNGDNENETFFVRNLPEEGNTKLIVSNRWGKQVYSSDNYDNSWDGGEEKEGVYFYTLAIPNDKVYTGWIEIIRGSR